MTDLAAAKTPSLARPFEPSKHATQVADIFLKRSAAYYHAQPASSLESAHATFRQRDPMLAETLQSLAPPDTHFSPASMHTRLQAAQQTLTTALAHLHNKAAAKNLIACAQTLQRQIAESLTLQQEASDNQRLLIKA